MPSAAPPARRLAAPLSALALASALFLPPALLLAPARAETPARAIQAAYAQINDALQRRDVDRAMLLYTSDYSLTDDGGHRLDRARAIQDYKDTMRDVRSIRIRCTVGRVTPAPNGAEWAEMRMHSEGTGEKRVLFARLRGTFTNDLHVRDLWVPTPRGWRLKYRQTFQDETRTHPG